MHLKHNSKVIERAKAEIVAPLTQLNYIPTLLLVCPMSTTIALLNQIIGNDGWITIGKISR